MSLLNYQKLEIKPFIEDIPIYDIVPIKETHKEKSINVISLEGDCYYVDFCKKLDKGRFEYKIYVYTKEELEQRKVKGTGYPIQV